MLNRRFSQDQVFSVFVSYLRAGCRQQISDKQTQTQTGWLTDTCVCNKSDRCLAIRSTWRLGYQEPRTPCLSTHLPPHSFPPSISSSSSLLTTHCLLFQHSLARSSTTNLLTKKDKQKSDMKRKTINRLTIKSNENKHRNKTWWHNRNVFQYFHTISLTLHSNQSDFLQKDHLLLWSLFTFFFFI